MPNRRVSLQGLRSRTRAGDPPLAGLTAYSFPQALALEQAEVDWILVGDSGGMVELGYANTRPVSLDQMLTMVGAVRRGAPSTFVVGDLPFGSYEESPQQAAATAIAFARAGDVDAVKLEGGARVASRVEAIASAGITVMGHLGLTPQSVSSASPYRVFGRQSSEVTNLIEDAHALKEAGASSILLEALPPEITKIVVESVDISFLGIGSGPPTDGQLLILHDILGLYPTFRPRFARNFAADVLLQEGLADSVRTADNPVFELMKVSAVEYVNAVRARTFPLPENCYAIEPDDLSAVEAAIEASRVERDGT